MYVEVYTSDLDGAQRRVGNAGAGGVTYIQAPPLVGGVQLPVPVPGPDGVAPVQVHLPHGIVPDGASLACALRVLADLVDNVPPPPAGVAADVAAEV